MLFALQVSSRGAVIEASSQCTDSWPRVLVTVTTPCSGATAQRSERPCSASSGGHLDRHVAQARVVVPQGDSYLLRGLTCGSFTCLGVAVRWDADKAATYALRAGSFVPSLVHMQEPVELLQVDTPDQWYTAVLGSP